MIIGVPKEIKEQEQRVALLPSGTNELTKHGHSVLVERNAGLGSGYPDQDYVKAGAEIVEQAKDVFARADMIVKVKEPLKAEFPLLRRRQILFTYLHLAASKSLTEALLKSGVTGVAYETIQVDHRLPLLEPMSEIAGRMSVVMGANFLAKYNGGSGVLLGGADVLTGIWSLRAGAASGGTSPLNERTYATSCQIWSSGILPRNDGMPLGSPSRITVKIVAGARPWIHSPSVRGGPTPSPPGA